MILLDALYINNSGGKVLLDYLVVELYHAELPVFFLLDKRVKGSYPFLPDSQTCYQRANLITRHHFYRKYASQWSKVLCFGNIPPSIKLQCLTYTYFHQLQYLQTPRELSTKERVLFWFKKEFIYRNRKRTASWLVQSKHMKALLNSEWGIPLTQIKLLPFFPPLDSGLQNTTPLLKQSKRFVYVSDGNSHKNHAKLLKAFEAAYQFVTDITMHLTISDNYPDLQKVIKEMQNRGIPIFNHGRVPKSEIHKLYRTSEFVIYPSLSESFGLGIIEGINMGCKVIGADLPYIYSVCSPSLIFNPHDITSIKECIVKASIAITSKTTLLVKNEIDELINILE